MSDQEKRFDQLEREFPASAGNAFASARARALAAGHGVVEALDGALYEVLPDGTRTFLKKIKPPVPARKGERFSLK
jgi:hypothetical protein